MLFLPPKIIELDTLPILVDITLFEPPITELWELSYIVLLSPPIITELLDLNVPEVNLLFLPPKIEE